MFITPWEVIKYSPLEKEFPTNAVSNVLEQTEMDCLNRYFGDEFRSLLESDLKIDSSVYIEYNPGTTYAGGTKVISNGLRYEANYSTAKVPGSNNPDWALYEIFKTSEYNDLWVRYLRNYLAFEIASPAVTFATYKAKGNGLMTFADQNTGQVTASQATFGIFKKELQAQCDSIKDLMTIWIKKAHATYADPLTSLFYKVSFINLNCNNQPYYDTFGNLISNNNIKSRSRIGRIAFRY